MCVAAHRYINFFSTSRIVLLSICFSRDDPTPSRGTQLPRAASLIISSLGFIHDLRNGLLEPDTVRGVPLDMDQYSRVSALGYSFTQMTETDVITFRSAFRHIESSNRCEFLSNTYYPLFMVYSERMPNGHQKRCPTHRSYPPRTVL